MNYRMLGKTGFEVSEVSLGTWQIGGFRGEPFDERQAQAIINRAIDLGVNFIDTSDSYGGGLSEHTIGQVLKARSEQVYVATKCGRKLRPHQPENYTRERIVGFVEDSLKNLDVEVIDLLQLHCPLPEIYDQPEVFGVLDDLKAQGKIRHYGVSVEKLAEAQKAITYPNLATVQIIFNMFRLKPAEEFFAAAQAAQVGIIARVPLASGLLTGKFTAASVFGENDHRQFNRDGSRFDKGETFSGVDFETGLQAVAELKAAFPNYNLTELALRWILMFAAVSCVIPGARNPDQAEANIGLPACHL